MIQPTLLISFFIDLKVYCIMSRPEQANQKNHFRQRHAANEILNVCRVHMVDSVTWRPENVLACHCQHRRSVREMLIVWERVHMVDSVIWRMENVLVCHYRHRHAVKEMLIVWEHVHMVDFVTWKMEDVLAYHEQYLA